MEIGSMDFKDPNQVDALRIHTEHEFWSAEEGREVLSPTSNPEAINSAPYTLKSWKIMT